MELWGSDKCIKKSEINAKNHCGGRETAAGTHTGGSISIGEHRKKLEKYEEIYVKKQCLNLILINVKYIIKLWGEKRREEYTGLAMKQKSTMGRIFLSQHLYHLQFLNQHQQQIWMSLSNK